MRRQSTIILLIIVVLLTASAGFFINPKFQKLPWQLGLDLIGGAQLTYEVDFSQIEKEDQSAVSDGLRDIMERRINMFGVSEPNVVLAKAGENRRLIVELAGITDVEEAIRQIGRTAFLEFRETRTDLSAGTSTPGEIEFFLTELNGRYLTKAQVVFDSVSGQPQVSLNFNGEGAKIFETLTEKNVGKPLAIYIDDEMVSAPRVNEKIIGGQAVITGLSRDEAQSLVNLLNAGALPAPINLVSQQLVGASLGEESLKKAILAGALGTLLVILFMIFYYRSFGLFSSLALIIYIVLTLAVFKSVKMTMSLSGIAGFILSIGMAVDANVLIFERTKEELKKGVSKFSAIEEGFKRAWPSIRDSNITTVISAIILYYFTSSFIRGFALALLIGVLVSMFSAITTTRAMLRTFVRQ